MDGFASQVKDILGLPDEVLDDTNIRTLGKVAETDREAFLSLVRAMNQSSIQICQQSASYLQGCFKKMKLKIGGVDLSPGRLQRSPQSGAVPGVFLSQDQDVFLCQVQEELEIPPDAFDEQNKDVLRTLTPDMRTPFLTQARVQLKNSFHFKNNRHKPRYVFKCLIDANSKTKRKLEYEDAVSQFEPAGSQLPPPASQNGRAASQQGEAFSFGSQFSEMSFGAAASFNGQIPPGIDPFTIDAPQTNFVGQHRNNRSLHQQSGMLSSRAGAAMAADNANQTRTGFGWVPIVDPEFDAEVVEGMVVGEAAVLVQSATMMEDAPMGEASSMSGMAAGGHALGLHANERLEHSFGNGPFGGREEQPVAGGQRTAPFAVQFASAVLGHALAADAKECLQSVPSMSVFHTELFCMWLWAEALARGAGSLSGQQIQTKCQEIMARPLPEHEAPFLNPPSMPQVDHDHRLRARNSYVQFSAQLARDEGELRLTPTLFEKEKSSNRVLRHFWQYRDRFLAVHVDDKLKQTRIGHTKKQLHDFLASESGVVFCGRRFKFLYEHDERVHLFAPIDSEADGDGDLNLEGEVPLAMRSREALLDWIGVLDEVNPSKRSDRISMAFTPTVFVQTLRKDQVRVLDDVMSEDGRYCFTDGCGSYGRDIQAALERYHPDGQMVCAIQVRIGSAKGMLVFDPNTEGVVLHKSMIKFECDRLELEIVEINCTAHARKDGDQTFRHSDMKLNVEIIQQLEHGGVPVAALEEVVEGVLEALREVFKSGSSAALLKALKNRLICDRGVKPSAIDTAIAGGLDFHLYPLRNWIEDKLNQECVAKLKALKIPIEHGTSNLFGVTLRDSGLGLRQVFIRLSPHEPPLQGRVVIGRHPCNHPGDLQVLEAVSSSALVQRLGHLHGVVVFPLVGNRPLPDMMGGGDLDGDTFWAIWDPRLIPARREEALDYGAYTPKSFNAASLGLHGPIRASNTRAADFRELVKQFVAFNSSVGMLTNLRKLAADKFGAKDPRTVLLCRLVSKAHDARTSGEHVPVPDALRSEVERTGWPCWWSRSKSENQGDQDLLRYRPEDGTLKAAAVLHYRISEFSFGLPPVRHDPQLAFPINALPQLDEAELFQAKKTIDEYYAQKRRMVQTKNENSASILRSLFEKRRRDSVDSTWSNAFEQLDQNAAKVFFSFPLGQAATADRLKRRAAAWYRASWERNGRQSSSTLLKIPPVLKYLVQLKDEAAVVKAVGSGNVPSTGLFLEQPRDFAVLRHNPATL